MEDLRSLHQRFMDFIYKKDGTASSDFVRDGKSLNAQASLMAYRNSVFGNLTNALGDIYPALKRCLGDTFFDAMAQRYIVAHPSHSPSLDHYGEHFSDFVSEFPPLKDYPYTADLACLEWAWHLAFHAKNEEPLDLSQLIHVLAADDDDTEAGIGYEAISFKLFESATLLQSAFPITQIWKASLSDDEESEIDLSSGPQSVMVWRSRDYEMRIDSLEPIEFDVLKMIKKQDSLGTIFEQLGSKCAPEEINHVLTKAVHRGWLAN